MNEKNPKVIIVIIIVYANNQKHFTQSLGLSSVVRKSYVRPYC